MAFWNRKKKSKAERDVDAADRISKSLDEMTKRRSAIFKGQRPDADDYGYTCDNPIGTSTIADSNKYLARLFTEDGEKLYWVRTGAIFLKELFGVPDVAVDYYQLYLHGEKHSEIYICPYSHNSSYVPKGMILKESYLGDGNGDLEKEAPKTGLTIEQFLEYQRLLYLEKTQELNHELKTIRELLDECD